MFNVKFGETSPRVTLLQVMLNGHLCTGADGRRLVVDGIFGRNTRAGVSSAARMLGVGDKTDGKVAGPELVAKLLAGVDLRVVTSVDIGDPRVQVSIDILKENFDDPLVLGGMCNGLQQFVLGVKSRATKGQMAALRMVGHGNLGDWLTVSVGSVADLRKGDADQRKEYAAISDEVYSYVSAKNFDKVNGIIQPLNALFAPFGFAEHYGCTLGARSATRKMLNKLATLWGVPIRVTIGKQPMVSVTDLKGPVFTAFPGAHSLASWSRQFNRLNLGAMSR
jgi:hypothetical protein